jgi:HK97 gp10 family phage protein
MIKVHLKSVNKLLKDLSKFKDKADKEIDIITKSNAQEIVLDAKQNAPDDLGFLRNNIFSKKQEEMNYAVIARAKYSAYMEFGTGGLVDVPDELKELAILFKGKGVKQIDLRPQPFLYPAYAKGVVRYERDLTNLLKNLTK